MNDHRLTAGGFSSNPGLSPWAIFDRPLRGLNVVQNLSPANITIGKLDDRPRPLPSPKGERFTDPLWETLNWSILRLPLFTAMATSISI